MNGMWCSSRPKGWPRHGFEKRAGAIFFGIVAMFAAWFIVVAEPDDGTVFLSNAGEPFSLDHVSDLVRVHVDAALSVDGKPAKRGACHRFRHTMAMLMLENGADIRYIQAMLGHADLKTADLHAGVHPATEADPLGNAPGAASQR